MKDQITDVFPGYANKIQAKLQGAAELMGEAMECERKLKELFPNWVGFDYNISSLDASELFKAERDERVPTVHKG